MGADPFHFCSIPSDDGILGVEMLSATAPIAVATSLLRGSSTFRSTFGKLSAVVNVIYRSRGVIGFLTAIVLVGVMAGTGAGAVYVLAICRRV